MSRPLGVTSAALAVLGVSAWLVSPAMRAALAHRARPPMLAAVVLAALALLAAEALWSLRPRAFGLFTLWSAAAMVMLVLDRLAARGSSHLAGFVPSIVYAGIAFAAAALYLRRAL